MHDWEKQELLDKLFQIRNLIAVLIISNGLWTATVVWAVVVHRG